MKSISFGRLAIFITALGLIAPAFANVRYEITPENLHRLTIKEEVIKYPPYFVSVVRTLHGSTHTAMLPYPTVLPPSRAGAVYSKVEPLNCASELDAKEVKAIVKGKSVDLFKKVLPLIKKGCFTWAYLETNGKDVTYSGGNLNRPVQCARCAISVGYPTHDYVFDSVLTEKTEGVIIRMTGLASWEKVYDTAFNSPFLVFSGAPAGLISVSPKSDLDQYANTFPLFNNKNGWIFTSDKSGSLMVGNQKSDHLFYELAIKSHTLTRNGKNFSTKSELINYLTTSDFYSKMGLTEKDKANSLGYILPKIEWTNAANYYLTILDDATIADNSSLIINPKPDTVTRRYYAIYPTLVPVKTVGDLMFPALSEAKGFSVKEYGEFLIDDTMEVLWK